MKQANSQTDPPKGTIKENLYTFMLDTASRLSGGRRPMGPDAEGVHIPKTSSPLYNESFYFNFFDQEKQAGGFMWIGKLPNQRTVNSVLLIYAPGGDNYALFSTEPYLEHTPALHCGPMSYEMIEPLKKWRILSSGNMLKIEDNQEAFDPKAFFSLPAGTDMVPVDLDITFTGIGPVHNSKDYCSRAIARQMTQNNFGLSDLAGVRKIAANHYEQVGDYEGFVRVNGERHEIRATGHRDHSWGIRDWTAPKAWTWLTAQFGGDSAFNLCRILIGNIDLYMGFTCRQGVLTPLMSAKLETEFAANGAAQKNIRFVLEDAKGFTMEVTGKAERLIRLAREEGGHKVAVHEALTRYEWEGKQAFGISEYLKKLS